MAKVLISENGILQNLIIEKTQGVERLKLYQRCIDMYDSGNLEEISEAEKFRLSDALKDLYRNEAVRDKVIYIALLCFIKNGRMDIDQVFNELRSEAVDYRFAGILRYKDNQGNTLLHHAAVLDNNKAIKILFKHGANPLVRNLNGKIPIDLANTTKNEFYESMKEQVQRYRCNAMANVADILCVSCGIAFFVAINIVMIPMLAAIVFHIPLWFFFAEMFIPSAVLGLIAGLITGLITIAGSMELLEYYNNPGRKQAHEIENVLSNIKSNIESTEKDHVEVQELAQEPVQKSIGCQTLSTISFVECNKFEGQCYKNLSA